MKCIKELIDLSGAFKDRPERLIEILTFKSAHKDKEMKHLKAK